MPEIDGCPMSIACHPKRYLIAAGINSSENQIRAGANTSCRLFNMNSNKIQHQMSLSVSISKQPQDYQKVTRFSIFGTYLATVFSDGRLSVFNTLKWQLCFPSICFKDVQDIDIDATEEFIVVATSSALIILSIEDGAILQAIDSPRFNQNTHCEFRACRFGMSSQGIQRLYAVVNATSRGRGFICAWFFERTFPVGRPKIMGVSRKSISSFSISPLEDLLAYASTDLSIGFVDAITLKHVQEVKRVSEFAMTSLVFSRSGRYLACAGVDDYCRVILVPQLNPENPFVTLLLLVFDMLQVILLVHIVVQWFK
ncbi:WD40-repeat-containing domain protein [Blakeslea trispora]|nr:WD40-repeat-containing domain protein [Blakeslea trispora]